MKGKLLNRSMVLPWVMCSLGAIYYCYEYFLRISPSVMASDLMRAYHLTGGQLGSLSAFYYHAYVPMQIVVGILMDRYGPRRLLTIACLLCVVGTVLFVGNHKSLALAAAGRFLVGFGSAFAFVGALKLATIWLPPNRFALVSGIITCLGMIGAMIGDVLLRALIDQIGWQATLYISAFAGVFLALALWFIVRDHNPYMANPQHHEMDFRKLFVGLWAALRKPQIWLNGLVGLLLYTSLSVFAELWGVSYLEQARGLSKVSAANANAMVFLGWAIGAPFWGWFSDYIRRRALPIQLASLGAVIFSCMLIYMPVLSPVSLYVLLFAMGFASSVQILVFAICHELSHIRIAGTAIAFTNLIVMLGGSIFQPSVGALLDSRWSGEIVNGALVYGAASYKLALSVLPISIGLAIIIMFFIRETYGTIQMDHHPR